MNCIYLSHAINCAVVFGQFIVYIYFFSYSNLFEFLPTYNRKRVSKFYNGESSSNVAGAAQPAQATASPGNPSPKKRKGFLSFSFRWNKSRSRRRAPSPAPASSSQGQNRGASTRAVVSASPMAAAALRSSQLIAVQMQAVCLEDVAESTASLCPREKRRKSLQ